MASEHSFDVVCKLDKQEVDNALQQTLHELGQRYDFKNAKYDVKFDQTAMTLTLSGDSEFRLQGLSDVLDARLAKRQIPLAAITREPIEVASGGGARQVYKLQTGIPSDKAKEIVKRVKDLKLKVQATIQSDQVRIAGKDLDELQAVQKAIRGADLKIHVQFVNYR